MLCSSSIRRQTHERAMQGRAAVFPAHQPRRGRCQPGLSHCHNEHLQSRSGMHMSSSCRDKEWMRGCAGALCLSWWPDESSGGGEARGSHPDEDRHKAPAPPLSLTVLGVDGPLRVPGHGLFWGSSQGTQKSVRERPPLHPSPVPTVEGAAGVRWYRCWSSTFIMKNYDVEAGSATSALRRWRSSRAQA